MTVTSIASAAAGPSSSALQLRHVLLFHRHGDRTPRLSPLLAQFVAMDEEEKQFWRSRAATSAELEQLSSVAIVVGATTSEPPHIQPPSTEDWPRGLLTHKGVEEMTARGRQLRQRYASFVDAWLGVDSAKLNEQVYVLSSGVPRCIQSVQCLLRGMFAAQADSETPPFVVHTYAKNVMSPAHSQQVFDEAELLLRDDIADRSCEERDATERLGRHIRVCLGIPDDRPTPWTIRDLLTCRKAHGRPFPEGITQAHAEQVEAYDAWLWHKLYSHRDFCVKAFRDGVLEVYSHLKKVVDGDMSETKLAFFSAHDNAIVALVAALQLQTGGVLPDYGAVLAFEVYLDRETDQHFVKAVFEGNEVTFGGHEHEFLCPFARVEAIALEFLKTN